jgi:hypothetical protein
MWGLQFEGLIELSSPKFACLNFSTLLYSNYLRQFSDVLYGSGKLVKLMAILSPPVFLQSP